MTRIIDSHVHILGRGYLPEKWYEIGAKKWAARTWPPRDASLIDIEGGILDEDAELLLTELEKAGIESAICLGLDWGVEFGEPKVSLREVTKHYGQLQTKHAGKIYGVAGIDPRRPDALEIFDEAVTRQGLKGLKIYPPSGYSAADPICFPLYEKCVEANVPVVIHTAFVGYPHSGHLANPININEVQVRYPDLTIVLAHSGHPIWAREAAQVVSYHPTSFLEISNWNDDMDRDPEGVIRILAHMRDMVGAHRMLFASDHLGGRRFSGDRSRLGDWVSFIDDLPRSASAYGLSFAREEVDLILGENAIRAFRLS